MTTEAAQPFVPNWQLISSAPKDGSIVLLTDEALLDRGVTITAQWKTERTPDNVSHTGWFITGLTCTVYYGATLWSPAPSTNQDI